MPTLDWVVRRVFSEGMTSMEIPFDKKKEKKDLQNSEERSGQIGGTRSAKALRQNGVQYIQGTRRRAQPNAC